LSPGESAKDYFFLGKSYDLSRPGTYTIQVVRWDEQRANLLVQPVKAVTAVSNALTVNVVEACKLFGVIRTTRFDSEFLLAQAGKSSRRAQHKYDCDTKDNAAKECPRLIHMIEPEYTEEARQAQVEGKVVLGMSIDKMGRVSDVHVLESLDKGLDEQAVAAVQQWKFRPAVNGGQPVPVEAKTELRFACQDAGAWR
jgi:TonB family protein